VHRDSVIIEVPQITYTRNSNVKVTIDTTEVVRRQKVGNTVVVNRVELVTRGTIKYKIRYGGRAQETPVVCFADSELAQRSNFKEELVGPKLHDPEEVSEPVRDDVDLAVRALERESVYLEARKIFNSLTPTECQELQCSVASQHGRMTQEERDKAEPQVRHEESSQLHQLVMKELSERVITTRRALQAEQERKDNLMKSQQLEEKLRDVSRAKGPTHTQSAEPRLTRKIASSSRERSKSADYVRTDVDQCANSTHLCAFTDPKDTTSKDLQAVIH
jgi:hypothetical protein